jgi:hypothetical protein
MDISVEWYGANDPRGILVLKSLNDQKEVLKTRLALESPLFDVTLLLDTSGSMQPHQEMLNTSLNTLKKLMPKCASIRTVVFDDYAREHYGKSIIVSSGKTNLASALEMIRPTDNPQLVLLLSDGFANTGSFTVPNEIVEYSRLLFSKYEFPIIFNTIGFNSPANLQLEILNGLAKMTDGNSHVVQTHEKVFEAFGDIVSELISITHADITFAGVQTDEKLHGRHLRVGETRRIPFTYNGNDLKISAWDITEKKQIDIEVPLKISSESISDEVREVFLVREGEELLREFIDGKAQFAELSRNLQDPFDDKPFYASPSLENAFGRSKKRHAESMRVLNNQARIENNEKIRQVIFNPIEAKIQTYLQNLPSSKFLDVIRNELTRREMNANDFAALQFDLTMRRSRIGGHFDFEASESQMASREISRHVSLNPEEDGQDLLTQRFQ